MPKVKAYACDDEQSIFHPTTIDIRDAGPKDVRFEVKYAGICHSDIHTARGEWGPADYPLTPGHEIAGIVVEVGKEVTKFAVGDRVGVGCLTLSCGECEYCMAGEEMFCNNPRACFTYGRDWEGKPTAGGYAQGFTINEDFALKIPESIPFETAAPLLCAGITTYSPLRNWGAGPGKTVGILGMGGLGHMGVKLAVAMGAEVHVISRTRSKEADARAFGAQFFHATSEEGTIESLRSTFDLIVCTVSDSNMDYDGMIRALKPHGAFVDVGLPEHPSSISLAALINGNKILAGSNIGGIAQTQEMLDFCAHAGVYPTVEVISADQITQAYNNVVASKVRYRYVIDTSTM